MIVVEVDVAVGFAFVSCNFVPVVVDFFDFVHVLCKRGLLVGVDEDLHDVDCLFDRWIYISLLNVLFFFPSNNILLFQVNHIHRLFVC